jgi:hypothetical protein
LYGWWPDRWRYRLRVARQGEQIMTWGIDFHQFTHRQLRRDFKSLGFSRVLDTVDIADPEHLNEPTPHKKFAVKMLKQFKMLKNLYLLFAPGTSFICIK